MMGGSIKLGGGAVNGGTSNLLTLHVQVLYPLLSPGFPPQFHLPIATC